MCPQRGTGRTNFLGPSPGQIDTGVFKELNFSLRGSLLIYGYDVPDGKGVVSEVFEDVYTPLHKLLTQLVDFYSGIRLSLRLFCDLEETRFSIDQKDSPIGSPWSIISHPNFIDKTLVNSVSFIIHSLNLFVERGSEWVLKRISRLEVHIGIYNPLNGRLYVPIPSSLKYRRGLINIKLKNSSICFHLSVMCFLFSKQLLESNLSYQVLCKSFKQATELKQKQKLKTRLVQMKNRVLTNGKNYLKYLNKSKIDFSSITVDSKKGVSLYDIDTFELNNQDFSVTVYKNVGKDIKLIRPTEEVRKKHLNLLLLEGKVENHYVYISDFAGLMGKHGTHRHLFCPICQKPHRSQVAFNRHVCGSQFRQIINPPKNNFFKFTKLHLTLKSPFVLYYHFYLLNLKGSPWLMFCVF